MKKRLSASLTTPSAKRQLGRIALLSAVGLGAGLLCGLLGAGGGVVLLLALQRIGKDGEGDLRDVFATSLAIMIPLALLACLRYSAYGSLSARELSPFLPAAILGGLSGGFLLGKIRLRRLRLLFAVLMAVSGALLLFRS